MALWFGNPTLEAVRATQNIGAMRLVGIHITALGDDYISGSLAVTEQLLQPYGILHGGINIVLAETLGSTAAALTLDKSRFGVVGQEINANHLRPALPGSVITGTARAFHVGARSQVWGIEIRDERERLTCVSRITIAVIDRTAGTK